MIRDVIAGGSTEPERPQAERVVHHTEDIVYPQRRVEMLEVEQRGEARGRSGDAPDLQYRAAFERVCGLNSGLIAATGQT